MASLTHHTDTVLGVPLHYVTSGSGPPVVLLPGWPETWYAWRHVISPLAEHHTVIAVDPPGLGDSGPLPDGHYDTRTVAAHIRGLVQQLDHPRILLVGHDVGSWIAYAYAVAYPNEVHRLVLLDAGLPGVSPPQQYPLPAEANIKAWQFSFNALPGLPELLTAGRERALFDWLIEQKASHPDRITPADREEYVRAYTAPGKMHAGFEYYRAVAVSAAQNKELSKAELPMPVLVLGGEKGLGEAMLHAVQPVATHATGGSVPDCGHYIAEERPDYLAARLLAFFAEQGQETA